MHFSTGASVQVAGNPVAGAEINANDNQGVAAEIGYALNPDWTMRFSLGVPPTATMKTGGSLNALVPPLTGTLGKVRYAPMVLAATYALPVSGSLRPYVGAGINYTRVINTTDSDIANLKVDSAWGVALIAGAELALNERWSLFIDARKIFVKTNVSGSITALGGAPAAAKLTLNPTIIALGVGYRF